MIDEGPHTRLAGASPLGCQQEPGLSLQSVTASGNVIPAWARSAVAALFS